MQRTTPLFFAAAIAVGLAVPANADYVRLGSVDVGFHTDLDTVYSGFGGRLESLRLTASRSDIFCRSVVVKYVNGDRQNVFSGRLDEHSPVDVDLRGRARRIDSIRFVCRSDEFRGGRIYIAGEVGRYGGEWRHSPDWDRRWGGIFGPDWGRRWEHDEGWSRDDGWDPNFWVSLGRESFEGRHDRESTYAGWAGRHVERLGLRPLDGDARCRRIVATFENGQRTELARDEYLERGRLRVFDLPGVERNLVSVYMSCRAVGDYRVVIEVYARK